MILSWAVFASIFGIALLETFLSIDNAVVLALIARELEPVQQKKALRYGLIGAIVLRLLAVGLATYLIHYQWVKIIGGLYLGYLAVRYFIGKKKKNAHKDLASQNFWKTVAMIEFTDLAFAVDSILAAVAISNQYWIVVAGGLIGVVTIRFAAQGMIRVLERFPKLESIAYALIAGVALKVIYEGAHSFL